MRHLFIALIVVISGLVAISALAAGQGVVEYFGMCNASAAVAVGGDRFVVADDEDKPTTFLRLYRLGQGGPPLAEVPVPDAVLDLDRDESLEVDIEGAAQVGERVYWIGSHSASKHGKAPNRRRLFATKLHVAGDRLTIEGIGRPYKHLIRDLADDDRYREFGLEDAAKIEPKEPGGLSIEGLAATEDEGLYIGFRNPIPEGKALIAVLKNPGDVIEGRAARFGKPIRLDLGGLGIRSLERLGGGYLIVAGRHDAQHVFRIYRWSGDREEQPQEIPGVPLDDLNPEALFGIGDGVCILSDDGKQSVGGRTCEDLPRAQQRFRGLRILP